MTGHAAKIITARDGRALAVRTAGNARATPIVFLHGQMHTGFCWDTVLRSRLSETFFLVAPDMAGHGMSEPVPFASRDHLASDLADILAACGVEEPILVAWSFGSVVASDFLRASHSARSLVLVGVGSQSPGLPGKDADDVSAALNDVISLYEAKGEAPSALKLFRGLLSRDRRISDTAVERMTDICRRNPLLPERRNKMIAEGLSISCETRAAIFGMAYDNRDIFSGFAGDILQIHGENDLLRPVATAHERDTLFRRGTTEIWAGSGHAPFDDETERFVSTLEAFARE